MYLFHYLSTYNMYVHIYLCKYVPAVLSSTYVRRYVCISAAYAGLLYVMNHCVSTISL